MNNHFTSILKNGDLLFVHCNDEQFSQVIAQSTAEFSTKENLTRNYTHVAILEKKLSELFVLHAVPKKGCIRQPLIEFLKDNDNVDVYRLKKEKIDFKNVIQHAKKLLGNPYNDSFIAEQPGYYCSEFICALFSDIFIQTPMTFGSKNTILPEWHNYYKNLNLPIPNGLPGSSPNSLIKQNLTNFVTSIPPFFS